MKDRGRRRSTRGRKRWIDMGKKRQKMKGEESEGGRERAGRGKEFARGMDTY